MATTFEADHGLPWGPIGLDRLLRCPFELSAWSRANILKSRAKQYKVGRVSRRRSLMCTMMPLQKKFCSPLPTTGHIFNSLIGTINAKTEYMKDENSFVNMQPTRELISRATKSSAVDLNRVIRVQSLYRVIDNRSRVDDVRGSLEHPHS